MGDIIKLQLMLRAFIRKETKNRWVAVCPSIDVASQGSSKDDAQRCLREAVELWFESCIERGVLDQAMRECNFLPLGIGEAPPPESDYVLLRNEEEPDVRGDFFPIEVAIPAYQASALIARA